MFMQKTAWGFTKISFKASAVTDTLIYNWKT